MFTNAFFVLLFNLLSAELIFLFSSYSAYLIARFAFFSVSIIFATAKFCGKVPDGQFQFAGAKFCVEIFEEVYSLIVAVSVPAVLEWLRLRLRRMTLNLAYFEIKFDLA